MRLLFLLPLLAGCTAPGPRGRGGDDLTAELAGRQAGAAERCVPANSSEALRIVDAHTLALTSGSTLYVSTLEHECPGLRPMDTLIVETQDSQHCRGDHFRAVFHPGGIPGPICILGDFTPYRMAH